MKKKISSPREAANPKTDGHNTKSTDKPRRDQSSGSAHAQANRMLWIVPESVPYRSSSVAYLPLFRFTLPQAARLSLARKPYSCLHIEKRLSRARGLRPLSTRSTLQLASGDPFGCEFESLANLSCLLMETGLSLLTAHKAAAIDPMIETQVKKKKAHANDQNSVSAVLPAMGYPHTKSASIDDSFTRKSFSDETPAAPVYLLVRSGGNSEDHPQHGVPSVVNKH
jgi:hypothetical protein